MFRPARLLLMTALVLTSLSFGLTNSAEAAGHGRSGGRTASSYRHGQNLGYRRHGYRHHGHHHYWHHHRYYWNRYYWDRYYRYRSPSWGRWYGSYGYAAPAVTTVVPAEVSAPVGPVDAGETAGPPEPSFEPEPPVAPPVARSVAKPATTIIQSVKVVRPKVVH
jgi:hypothetical protein